LEVEPSQTKRIAFGRFAREQAQGPGKEPETFDFLGFTHYCAQTRYGSFKGKRRTTKKKFRAKRKEITDWLQRERNRLKTGELWRQATSRLVGQLNY
jgi:RNA-directed DNA polymerase